MPFIDFTDDGPAWGAKEPGDYAAEVDGCEEKVSKKGAALFVVAFKDINTGNALCDDVIMLEGKGKGIGIAKLRALGFEENFQGDMSAAELIGRRCIVHLSWDDYGGKKQLRPNMKEGDYCGYSKIESQPKAIQDNEIDPFSKPAEEKLDDENIPF